MLPFFFKNSTKKKLNILDTENPLEGTMLFSGASAEEEWTRRVQVGSQV